MVVTAHLVTWSNEGYSRETTTMAARGGRRRSARRHREPGEGVEEGDEHRDVGVHHLLAGAGDRPAGHELLELGKRHDRTGERDAADDHAEEDFDDLVDGKLHRFRIHELGERDECRGTSADAVEGGTWYLLTPC